MDGITNDRAPRERYGFVPHNTHGMDHAWYDVEDRGDFTHTPRVLAVMVRYQDAVEITHALNECDRIREMARGWLTRVKCA
jgi:hypothetical protein